MNNRERYEALRRHLLTWGVDGVLFFDMTLSRYFSGFTGSDGVLYVNREHAVLLVDGRYTTQARQEARGASVFEYAEKMRGIGRIVNEAGDGVVAFDATHLSYDGYTKLISALPGVTFTPISDEMDSLRTVKDDDEIDLLRKAAHIAARSLTETLRDIAPGMRETEIADRLDASMKAHGGERSSFGTIVASGARSALPHARPTSRAIERGDFIIIDYGTVAEGYRSDETCTVAVGSATEEMRRVYSVVKDAHDRAIDAVRDGVSAREVDRVARDYIAEHGYGDYFVHGTGHGVGLDVHEYPRLSQTSTAVLEAGMVVTVEPGVYFPDRWGIRIEDTIIVERDGSAFITEMPKDFTIVA